MTDRNLIHLTSYSTAQAREKGQPFSMLDTAADLIGKTPLYYMDKGAETVCVVNFPDDLNVRVKTFGAHQEAQDWVKEHEHRFKTLPVPPTPDDYYLYNLEDGTIMYQSWTPEADEWYEIFWERFSLFPKKNTGRVLLAYSRSEGTFYRTFNTGSLPAIGYIMYHSDFMLKAPASQQEAKPSPFGLKLLAFLLMKKYNFSGDPTWNQLKDILHVIEPETETRLTPKQIASLDDAWSYQYGESYPDFNDESEGEKAKEIYQFFRENGSYSLLSLAKNGYVPFTEREEDCLLDIPDLSTGILSAHLLSGILHIFFDRRILEEKTIQEILDLDEVQLYPVGEEKNFIDTEILQ